MPGVVSRKLSVMMKVIAAPMPPMADAFGENARIASNTPIEISMAPIRPDRVCKPSD